MKTIWMLAAAATLVACGGRGEDDMGAAPDRGDTTAVTTGADTSVTTGVDTSMVQAPRPIPRWLRPPRPIAPRFRGHPE